jgi:3-oxoacyl-[acyl-carrier protein] reductase
MNNRESRSSLAGRTALVTGGSRGVGAATSKLLAARGANVIVNYFSNKEAADKVIDEINKEARGTEGYAIAIQADISKQTQVEYMIGEAVQRYGRIDIVVNNAMVGRYFQKPFMETTWDDFLEKIQ